MRTLAMAALASAIAFPAAAQEVDFRIVTYGNGNAIVREVQRPYTHVWARPCHPLNDATLFNPACGSVASQVPVIFSDHTSSALPQIIQVQPVQQVPVKGEVIYNGRRVPYERPYHQQFVPYDQGSGWKRYYK